MYADGIQMKILMNELNMNYGAIYENVRKKENIRYYPIYMIAFVQKEEPMDDLIYKPDLSILM